ncbi:MAG: hypothetical protein ACKVOR_10685 [Flavobacteriales bacterium]
MTKNFTLLKALPIATGIFLVASCTKEMPTGNGNASITEGKKVVLNEDQERKLHDMVSRVPIIQYYDLATGNVIELDIQNRDFSFVSPPDGWYYNDADGDGVEYVQVGDNDYLVFSGSVSGGGSGGGGTVVAGNSALNIDIAICLSLQEVGDGEGYGNLFDSGFSFPEFAAVFGIAGDFEALAEADTESEDFDPFEYFHGFAEYFVLADELAAGSYDVFDWMESDGTEDYFDNGWAAAFLMDFQEMAIYFSTDGTITVASSSMTFNGEYLGLIDIFDAFLDGEDYDVEAAEVSGFGTMGCG